MSDKPYDLGAGVSSDGMLYVSKGRDQILHANLRNTACPEIHLASHAGFNQIVVDKMYGPMIGIPLRITVDTERNAWVIDRQQRDGNWGEVAAIPLQLDSDFDETPDA